MAQLASFDKSFKGYLKNITMHSHMLVRRSLKNENREFQLNFSQFNQLVPGTRYADVKPNFSCKVLGAIFLEQSESKATIPTSFVHT